MILGIEVGALKILGIGRKRLQINPIPASTQGQQPSGYPQTEMAAQSRFVRE
jgi:hypothetical protein